MLQNFEALLQRTKHPIQTGWRGPARLLHRAQGQGRGILSAPRYARDSVLAQPRAAAAV